MKTKTFKPLTGNLDENKLSGHYGGWWIVKELIRRFDEGNF